MVSKDTLLYTYLKWMNEYRYAVSIIHTLPGSYSDTEMNIRALDQISYSRGQANMAAAFRALRTEMFNGGSGDRASARNVAFFLTDGTNDVERELTESEAEQTISNGVQSVFLSYLTYSYLFKNVLCRHMHRHKNLHVYNSFDVI